MKAPEFEDSQAQQETPEKFLVFLASNLDQNKELLMLVQKRYDECDYEFRISKDFHTLVNNVQSKMESEKHRIFVHLKDFLSNLKSHRVELNDKRKRKKDVFSNNLAKRLCTGNSCSDVSSDSDFFKKVKNRAADKDSKDERSSVKSDSPNDIDASNSPSSSTVKKTDKDSNAAMGKSTKKPWPVSDEESLSRDSVRSDTKSSDNSDLPSCLNSIFSQEPESVSVDSVSSESKCLRLTPSPSTSRLSLNKKSNAPLPNRLSGNKKKTATELSESQVSEEEEEVIPVTHVVIDDDDDDDDSCSDQSLPSVETQVLNIDDTKSTGTVKNAANSENDDEANNDANIENDEGNNNDDANIESLKEQKKKKGSERQIKRLEKLLGDIRDEIENSSKRELDLEDMAKDDSTYLYEDRLQKKFIKVWEKLCELKGQDTSTGRPIEKKFHFKGTRYLEVNKRIEKFINKKKIFPDYNDIKKIVTQVNQHYNLYLGKSAIEDLSREAFTDVGNQLQERRHKNFILTFGSSQTDVGSITEDPALYNSELRKKLEENRKLAKTQLDEVISKYARKQYETNAQPEEVDENAIDSSSEEEEEEEEAQDIPELDEVMALSDDDEDEISEIPGTSSTNLGMPLTKNLKIKIEKLAVPPSLLKKNCVPSPSASASSCRSSTATKAQNVNQNNTITTIAIPNTGLKKFTTDTSKRNSSSSSSSTQQRRQQQQQMSKRILSNKQDSKSAASNEIVIDLDSSSDADDSTEVISTRGMQKALVPFRGGFTPSTVNSFTRAMTSTSSTSSSSSSSSSGTMVMSSQNSMQFSMQVKTQYQQQQKQDGFSLKIASVASLAYSINDPHSNRQYFTSQQSNFQNQNFQLTPGNTYKQISKKPSLPAPSNNVIVLSDSD